MFFTISDLYYEKHLHYKFMSFQTVWKEEKIISWSIQNQNKMYLIILNDMNS